MRWQGLINRYGAALRIAQYVQPVTLCEGNTPLIPVPRLSTWIGGGAQVFVKYEGLNPTGSFKDRGMTTAITQAVAENAEAVICASTGNTSASAAAYAARAGLRCIVLIPDGKIALGKLAASVAYGAEVVSIRGSFDDGLNLVREIASTSPIVLVNSVNPARLEGQKTAAWEICEQLGAMPDRLCLPVGNAGNISAYWMGFSECSAGECPNTCGCREKRRPKLLGAQASGSAPIVLGRRIEQPETRATAIRIGNPARWKQAEQALQESGGHILAVTDEEIFEAYHALSRLEGVFCEPSSAAGVAGLRKSVQQGLVIEGETIVCVLTGHGLKDPDSATADVQPPITIDAKLEALKKHLKV
ncbi:MAG: threonine synthase [Armatimonadetes bacterium]|nr:threonine synthase [Armatimonadota bacterium]